MPELSIIVPVYKVEKYLPKCIDSILAQTFTDFELILIDDGSPDNCGAICDEYAKRDNRIIVIHQENQGVSAARNAGLDVATGTYLGFVDSDDWIEPEMYETMICVAKEKQVDVVACGINHYSENAGLIFSELESELVISGKELQSSIFSMPNVLGGCIWNKVYFRGKIEPIRYQNGIAMAEDRLYLFYVFSACNSCVKIGQALYSVVEREDSATHKRSVNVPYEMIESSFLLYKLALNSQGEVESKAADKFLDDCLVHIPLIREIGRESGEKYIRKIVKSKCLMLRTIIKAYKNKLLSKQKIHGYLFELIRI